MNFQPRPHLTTADRRLPFDCIVLLLQGGGALGAYQGGVYEALAEANIHPDWIAGISLERLTLQLSRAMRPIPELTGFASFGRR